MKFRFLCFALLLLAGCEENHQHDGVYISEQPILGIMKTWIVEGNSITFYLMGVARVEKCRQYEDRIESNDLVFRFDDAGSLIVPDKNGNGSGEKLIKRSANTKFTPAELEKMVDEAMPPPGVLKDRQ
jgi:hypothetical protein